VTKNLYIDCETYSETPIRDGLGRYSNGVEVLVVSYAIDDGAAQVWDVTGLAPMPADLGAALDDPQVLVWAHNVTFDRTMLKAALGIDLPLHRWRCSMCLALMHSMPAGLDALCAALALDQGKRKLTAGRKLVLLFCTPKSPRATALTHPAEWIQFLEYAAQDIVAMRECVARLPKWNLTDSELALWRLDQVINERGVRVDLEFCQAALKAVDSAKALLNAQTAALTDGEIRSTTQRDATLAYILKAYGVSLPDMQAGTLERRLEDQSLPDPVRELLANRLRTSSTSSSKYKAFVRCTSADGRLRWTLQFGGAMRTNRWSSRQVQLHNLSRVPKYLKAQYDFAIETIKSGAVDLIYDNPMEVLGSTVRGALVASPGTKFCRADLSNIEGRVLAWMADEQWKVDAFARGDDLYVEGYAKAFHVPVAEVLADEAAGGQMRLIGKVMELSCISEDQLVLTDQGLVPIQYVTTEMRVWDGVGWVTHDGVVDRGLRGVIEYDGLVATPDHLVWADDQDEAVPFRAAIGRRLIQSAVGLTAAYVGALYPDLASSSRRLGSRDWWRGSAPHHLARVYDIVNCGPRNRFTVSGKLVHNCGYGGAVDAFKGMAQIYGVDVSEPRALEIVRAWRAANHAIMRFWYRLEDAVTEATHFIGKVVDCGRLRIKRSGNWLRICLPSGRELCYPMPQYKPRWVTGEDGTLVENRDRGISFMGLNQYSRKWERVRTYGAKCVENVTQAVARDVFAEGLKRVEAAGYPIVLHVHDEVITEVPDSPQYSGERVAELMATNAPWNAGLPLAAEGSELKRYRK
jgi:DNA polymerase